MTRRIHQEYKYLERFYDYCPFFNLISQFVTHPKLELLNVSSTGFNALNKSLVEQCIGMQKYILQLSQYTSFKTLKCDYLTWRETNTEDDSEDHDGFLHDSQFELKVDINEKEEAIRTQKLWRGICVGVVVALAAIAALKC